MGVRADLIQLPTVSGPAAAPQVDGTHLVTSLDPRLGLVINALPNLNFKLLYGRAFRAPTIQELADATPQNDYAGGRNSGNPRLSPATVDTLELGGEHVLATSEGKLRLRGDLFWNRFSSPILAVDSGGNDAPLQNRDPGLDVKGVEAEARFEASARASVFANYAWFHAVDLAALSSEFERLTDVPQYRMSLGLQLPVGPYLNLDVVTLLGAERRNNDLSKLEALHHFKIPAYALVHVQLRTELLLNHFEVALLGTNVLQQAYRDDVPRPDRVPDLLPGPGFAGELLLRFRL
jgi:outer membrane receptor protein involved in Fe transport